jgi:hypothetical protein
MPYKWSTSQSSLLSHNDYTDGGTATVTVESVDDWSSVTYRLYKRRFVGLFGLVRIFFFVTNFRLIKY